MSRIQLFILTSIFFVNCVFPGGNSIARELMVRRRRDGSGDCWRYDLYSSGSDIEWRCRANEWSASVQLEMNAVLRVLDLKMHPSEKFRVRRPREFLSHRNCTPMPRGPIGR
jgi:hypothetical protein